MNIEVEFEERSKIVTGRISGELTREIAMNYFTTISEVAANVSCERVLTDMREASLRVSPEDKKGLSQEFAQVGMSSSYRRAIVLRGDEEAHKEWEAHCFMTGFKNLRLFVDFDVAKEWLSEQ